MSTAQTVISLFAGLIFGASTGWLWPTLPGESETTVPSAASRVTPVVPEAQTATPWKGCPEEPVSANRGAEETGGAVLPEEYSGMIGEPPSKTTPVESFEAKHVRFAQDRRDESWAFAMEAGIRNRIEEFGTGEQTVIEYIECRSRYCEIAGYTTAPSGAPGPWWEDIYASGWWLADGPYSNKVATQRDGTALFILLIERYAD